MTGSQTRTGLSKIIDNLVIEANPNVLDDDMPDLMADGDKRSDAIDKLIEIIKFYREEL